MARDRIIYRFAWLAGVGLPLLAAAVALFLDHLVLALVLVLLCLALSAMSLAGHLRLRIQLADTRRSVLAARSAQPSPTVTSPVPAPSPAAADRAELIARLGAIEGSVLAELAAVEERAVDRVIGLLRDGDTERPDDRLHAHLGRRVVAVAGSDSLVAALPPALEVHRLIPSQVAATMEATGADTIIIEESHLAEGPWRSTLLPQGAPLLSELRAAMAPGAAGAPRVYVIAQPGMPGIAARGLREGAVVVDERFERPAGAAATLLDSLIAYRETDG